MRSLCLADEQNSQLAPVGDNSTTYSSNKYSKLPHEQITNLLGIEDL